MRDVLRAKTPARWQVDKGKRAAHAPAMKTAIVLGSTGLIGSELVSLLEASPHYRSILLLNRRPSGRELGKVSERLIDFEAPDLAGLSGDDLYCAFGTTRRRAGSAAAFQRIDCAYPTTIATHLREQGVTRVFLVSSVGAKTGASGLYLRTKGQLEANLIGLGFAQTVIARPSLLLGQRSEFRLGEKTAAVLMKGLTPFMVGALRKYRPVAAASVARCLVQAAEAGEPGVRFIASDQMQGSR